ncbi:hypothetical protein Tco_0360384 [Tanacetum coccineum]
MTPSSSSGISTHLSTLRIQPSTLHNHFSQAFHQTVLRASTHRKSGNDFTWYFVYVFHSVFVVCFLCGYGLGRGHTLPLHGVKQMITNFVDVTRMGSNSTLRNHITHPHCEAIKAQQNQNPASGQTSMARDGSVFRYDPDYPREQFVGLVIQRALPFNHFDHEQTTRVFQNTMQPRYTHVSRSTLKRDAMKLWLAAKQEIIDSFGNINACVNLTMDVWFAPYGVPDSYMCVTAHWIELGTWQMMKRVISFEEFSSPHMGGAMFKMLIKVLTNFNLEDKV